MILAGLTDSDVEDTFGETFEVPQESEVKTHLPDLEKMPNVIPTRSLVLKSFEDSGTDGPKLWKIVSQKGARALQTALTYPVKSIEVETAVLSVQGFIDGFGIISASYGVYLTDAEEELIGMSQVDPNAPDGWPGMGCCIFFSTPRKRLCDRSHDKSHQDVLAATSKGDNALSCIPHCIR